MSALILENQIYLLTPFLLQFLSLLLMLLLLIINIEQQHAINSDNKQKHQLKRLANGNNNDNTNNNIVNSSRHISWQEYFMSVAQLAAKRSKDPSTQVGACIVTEQNKIVATGYNGMPNGVRDNLVPWTKEGTFLETKYAYVVHAELNAILNCILTDQTGCRLFVSLFPCNECAKAIIQSGIRHVIYLSDKHKDRDTTKAAKKMFKMAGVHCEQYCGHLSVGP